MANFTSVLDLWRFSRVLPRRAEARPRSIAVLVAAVVFLSASGFAHPRFAGSSREWSDARAVQAPPSHHSLALHRAAGAAARLHRRQPSHWDIPLATVTGQSLARTPDRGIVPPAGRPRPTAAVVARGYDATAPPVS